jgi:hypothetical protein
LTRKRRQRGYGIARSFRNHRIFQRWPSDHVRPTPSALDCSDNGNRDAVRFSSHRGTVTRPLNVLQCSLARNAEAKSSRFGSAGLWVSFADDVHKAKRASNEMNHRKSIRQRRSVTHSMRQRESLTSQISWLKGFTRIYVPFVRRHRSAPHPGAQATTRSVPKLVHASQQ